MHACMYVKYLRTYVHKCTHLTSIELPVDFIMLAICLCICCVIANCLGGAVSKISTTSFSEILFDMHTQCDRCLSKIICTNFCGSELHLLVASSTTESLNPFCSGCIFFISSWPPLITVSSSLLPSKISSLLANVK